MHLAKLQEQEEGGGDTDEPELLQNAACNLVIKPIAVGVSSIVDAMEPCACFILVAASVASVASWFLPVYVFFAAYPIFVSKS